MRNDPHRVRPPHKEPVEYLGVGLVLGVQKHATGSNAGAWERSVPKAYKRPK
jgi:hypothetical protein